MSVDRKSTPKDLENRGMITENVIGFDHLTVDSLIKKINSDLAVERTSAVIALRAKCSVGNENYIRCLLERLRIETALYTRMEICSSLEMGNETTAKLMCEYLGVIGNNQHKTVPDKVSKKKSYPLPRDMIARTMGRMNPTVISVLIEHLNIDDRQKISELLDAIGYMIYYHRELASVSNFNRVKETMEKYSTEELIVWRTALCCSAFPLTESLELLNEIKAAVHNETVIAEAERSIKLLKSSGKLLS